MSELTDLQNSVIAFRDARDWKQFHNPKDLAIALNLEASEVLEHFLWRSKEEMDTHITEKKTEIEDELADVFWWLLIMAHDLHIDLIDAVRGKLERNEKRYAVEKAKGNHKKYTELSE